MSEISPPAPARVSSISYLGLFVALFGMLIARQLVNVFWPGNTFGSAVLKEIGMWIVAIVLVVIIRRGEGLPLSSVGFSAARLGRSLLRGLLVGIACFLVAGVIVHLTHFNGGEAGKAMSQLPLWFVTLIVIRAGIVEELCYRGYAIERLHALGLPRSVAALVPLVIFGVGHWTGGWANILLALALGGILAAFYVWRRDLLANMFGHFLVDFVPNVLSRLFGAA
ncbi:MAG: CPBP family intramembrane glutamic endopeptidase [Chthoniobacterales bacterium]